MVCFGHLRSARWGCFVHALIKIVFGLGCLTACTTGPSKPLGAQGSWVRSGYDSHALMLETKKAQTDGGRLAKAAPEPSVVKKQTDDPPQDSKSKGTAPSRLMWPVDGSVIQRYGAGEGGHDGIDIEAERGTRVRAAADGEVLFTNRHGDYGNLVLVRHAGGLVTVYAHLETSLVRKGQKIKRGEALARVGSTGATRQPKLHFEVRQGVSSVNPMQFLPP